MERYFLNKDGAKTKRMQGKPGEGHYDIAQEVLAEQGVVPMDRNGLFQRMFGLGFVRVLEQDDNTVQVDHPRPLTSAQRRYIERLKKNGKRVVMNNPAFVASRGKST